jgi:hypothetical protein
LYVDQRYPKLSSAKAVADGSVAYYVDNFVHGRVAQVTYGTLGWQVYKPRLKDHTARKKGVRKWTNGAEYIPNAFFPLVLKVCVIYSSLRCLSFSQGTTIEVNQVFVREFTDPFPVDEQRNITLRMPVVIYTGDGTPPKWKDEAKNERAKTE